MQELEDFVDKTDIATKKIDMESFVERHIGISIQRILNLMGY
jgi:hypothetical protein